MLTSRLFAGDPAFEACAVKDSAHLTPGLKGPAVAKVQYALGLIDGPRIAPGELSSQKYGPSTANAVLAFKKQRSIINHSYQQTEDNIVGRMTIAALDAEMARRQKLDPATGECERCGTAHAPTRQGFVAESVGGGTRGKPQLGHALRVIFAQTSDVLGTGKLQLGKQIEVARDALFEYGITLSVEVKNGVVDTLPIRQKVVVEDDLLQMRGTWENLRPGLPGILRVIVCRMAPSLFGETHRDKTVNGQKVKPFVTLNNDVRDLSDCTLLHEMIHASHPRPQDHDPEKFSVFCEHGSETITEFNRSALLEKRARELTKAFFSL